MNTIKQAQQEDEIDEKYYCPPLDTSLFLSIVNDVDRSDPSSIKQVREILDSLKESAEIEQLTDFEPSGVSGVDKQDEAADSLDLVSLSVTDRSGITNITDASTPAVTAPENYDEGIEELSDVEKINLLSELCPETQQFDIQFTLKQCKGSFLKSLDQLLTHRWMKSNNTLQKSVDGFFVEQARRKNRNKKKNKYKATSSPENETEDDLPLTQNAWMNMKDQIDFIASRVHVSEAVVRAAYHQAGGTLRGTILNLCKVDISGIAGTTKDDPVIQANAFELNEEFKDLSPTECLALIVLTHPFSARAHELAKAVFAPAKSSISTPVTKKIVAQYKKLNLDQELEHVPSGIHMPMVPPLDQKSLKQASLQHAQTREEMFSKANAAWRKSRSQRLMSAAAAVYAEDGRRANAASRAYSSAAADAQVQSTNTGRSIDLHGLNVQDAVRSAKKSVEQWWNSGQAEWAREGKASSGNGFTIITGAGTHSAGGVAKIRPAVSRMLKSDGWRVEEDLVRGQVIVLGRVRAR